MLIKIQLSQNLNLYPGPKDNLEALVAFADFLSDCGQYVCTIRLTQFHLGMLLNFETQEQIGTEKDIGWRIPAS